MKRQCPNCNEHKVYRKIFATHNYMKCQSCSSLYTYPISTHIAISILIIAYPLIAIFISISLLQLFLLLPSLLLITELITMYFPLKQINNEDIAFTFPFKVDFEKTDDVNTNIERYREAMKEAKEEKLKEKTNKIFK